MYHRILVPLDGSGRAERILSHVEWLALNNQARVVFLQVVQPEIVGDGYKSILIDQSEKLLSSRVYEAQKYLDQKANIFREKGIKAQAVVEKGAVVPTILRVASREAVDLIAMASHGRGGLSRVFYGSVAAGILHAVDRPLLLIRARKA